MSKLLKLSLEEQKPIDMIYQSESGKITQRIIRVLFIGEEHIKAYCYLRKKERLFRKDNILSVATIRRVRKEGA